MRKRSERHVGAAKHRHLARISMRRHKRGKAIYTERYPKSSLRTANKAKLYELMLDQITADKLLGLEDGKICRRHYREQRRKARKAA